MTKSDFILEQKSGLLLIKMDDGFWLIDTGSPVSFSRDGRTVYINGMGFQTYEQYIGFNLNLDEISSFVGVRLNGVLGTNVLNEQDVLMDVPGNKICFYHEQKPDLTGDWVSLPLHVFNMLGGVYTAVDIQSGDHRARAFLDTGAHVNYAPEAWVTEEPSLGEADDFYPGIGAFSTSVYELSITIAEKIEETFRFGILPDLLRFMLEMVEIPVIVGSDFFVSRSVFLSIRHTTLKVKSFVVTQPYDTWAKYYDCIYDHYPPMSQLHTHQVQAISRLLEAQQEGDILDVGAGTGRLTVALDPLGRTIVAVEPSSVMVEQIKSKLKKSSHSTVYPKKIQDCHFEADRFCIAFCLFTVICHWLDEDEMEKAFSVIHQALMPGGLLLIDVAQQGLFNSHRFAVDGLVRDIDIQPKGNQLFHYIEQGTLRLPSGEQAQWYDEFDLKSWSCKQCSDMLDRIGFDLVAQMDAKVQRALTTCSTLSYANYLLFRKR